MQFGYCCGCWDTQRRCYGFWGAQRSDYASFKIDHAGSLFHRLAGRRGSTYFAITVFGNGGGALLEGYWVLYTTDFSDKSCISDFSDFSDKSCNSDAYSTGCA
jgi:hypothetical protein